MDKCHYKEGFCLELDGEQDPIVANIVAGNSVAVTAGPGTGSLQTVVSALGGSVDGRSGSADDRGAPGRARASTIGEAGGFAGAGTVANTH